LKPSFWINVYVTFILIWGMTLNLCGLSITLKFYCLRNHLPVTRFQGFFSTASIVYRCPFN
jgi:hypothetical protein